MSLYFSATVFSITLGRGTAGALVVAVFNHHYLGIFLAVYLVGDIAAFSLADCTFHSSTSLTSTLLPFDRYTNPPTIPMQMTANIIQVFFVISFPLIIYYLV